MTTLPLSPAPIVLFAYKRYDALKQTVQALQQNTLAAHSTLYIFVDGPKGPADAPRVDQVKQFLDTVDGFARIERRYSDVNRGLARSVIRGVSQVIGEHGRAIILEDDLITAPTFLSYMNACLQTYQHEPKVYSVSGYTFPFRKPGNYPHDAYFFPRYASWGWATWADRWQSVDWDMTDYPAFLTDKAAQARFAAGGSDLLRMLREQMDGKLDSWAIRWGYHQAKHHAYTVYPVYSKVDNIGFDQDATHTNIFNRYKTTLDQQETRPYQLPTAVVEDPYYSQSFRRKYSVETRIVNRLKTLAGFR